MRFATVASAFAVASLSACATHGSREAQTSGLIGCPTAEVKISDKDIGWTTNTWTAECRGKTFYCTYTAAGGTTCTESIASP